jgi:flagellin-like protein
MIFFNSKKGVSPLIATILLIAFAVALGSVIMQWGLNLNLGKSSDPCGKVDIRVRNIEKNDLCFGGGGNEGYINFIVDNEGGVDVNGLAIWIIGEKDTELYDLDGIYIPIGSLFDKTRDKEVTYDISKISSINEVQFIPKISVDNNVKICPKNSVRVEKIGACA